MQHTPPSDQAAIAHGEGSMMRGLIYAIMLSLAAWIGALQMVLIFR